MTYATARDSDPSTSHEAAANVAISQLEEMVYRFMQGHRGRYMNSIEIADAMRIDKWSVSPRLRPLWEKGFLLDPIKMPALNSAGNIRNLLHWQVK